MKVNEIIAKLEKAGFKNANPNKLASITAEGAWLKGKYLGTSIYKGEDGDKINQRFEVIEGEAMIGKDAKSLTKLEAGVEYTLFGSGLLNWILANQHKVGDTVAVVYEGMGSYKEGKKTIKSHQFRVMAQEAATK